MDINFTMINPPLMKNDSKRSPVSVEIFTFNVYIKKKIFTMDY